MSVKPNVTNPRTAQDLLPHGPNSVASACRLMSDAAAEVATAHDRGLLHLGLAPGAILLDGDGRYDGILDSDDLAPSATSLSYTAPEILVDAKPDARADVYSMAAVLLALLTGRAPFRSRNATAQGTITRILSDEPDLDLPGVPDSLRQMLAVAMRKNPAHRELTAAEFSRVTGAVGRGESVVEIAGEPVPAMAAADANPRVKWRVGLFAIVLFFGFIFVGAIAARLAPDDDIGVELVRSEIPELPEPGGAVEDGIVVAPVTTSAAGVDDAETVESEVAGTTETADDEIDAGFDPDAVTREVAQSFSGVSGPEIIVDEASSAAEAFAAALRDAQYDAADVRFVPLLKAVRDDLTIDLGDGIDLNVLSNDSIEGREIAVEPDVGTAVPDGFLLTRQGRLVGTPTDCGRLEVAYRIVAEDGSSSTSSVRIDVVDC